MEKSFAKNFKSKTSLELIDIVNSNGYQEAARTAATNLLVERGEQHLLQTKKVDFSELSNVEVFERLANYGYNHELTSKSLRVFKNQRTGLTGTILLIAGVLSLLLVVYNWIQGNTDWTLRYGITFGLIAIIIGWSRLKTDNYSYLTIEPDILSIKKSNDETSKSLEIDKTDFEKFTIRKYRNSISIFMNSVSNKPLSVANFKLKAYEPTLEYAHELAERLNKFARKR